MRIKRRIRLKGQLTKKPDNVITAPEPPKSTDALELLGEIWQRSSDCPACAGSGWMESTRPAPNGQHYPVGCQYNGCEAGRITQAVWRLRGGVANRLRQQERAGNYPAYRQRRSGYNGDFD